MSVQSILWGLLHVTRVSNSLWAQVFILLICRWGNRSSQPWSSLPLGAAQEGFRGEGTEQGAQCLWLSLGPAMFTYRTGGPEAEVSVYREDLWGGGGRWRQLGNCRHSWGSSTCAWVVYLLLPSFITCPAMQRDQLFYIKMPRNLMSTSKAHHHSGPRLCRSGL